MITAVSTPNIALIKYWGNRNDDLRLCAGDSLSITLESPTVTISVEHSPTLSVRSAHVDGSERILKEKDLMRFEKHLALCKRYLTKIGLRDGIPHSISMNIVSAIPSSIGIASSAAVFSAVAMAYAELATESVGARHAVPLLSKQQISILARLGSGSAARSIYGGFVALVNDLASNEIDSAYAEQIEHASHWELHDVIIVPSTEEKKVGSTEGHAGAHTSPYFTDRLTAIRTRRQQECTDAIRTKDFEKLQRISEEDCMDMHHVMETQNPPLKYLSSETHRIIKEVTDLRTRQHLPVLYTMDAGPTVHLFCQPEALQAIKDYAHAKKNCLIVEAAIGNGACMAY